MWMIIMIMALSFMWSDDTTQTRFSFYKTREYSVLRSVQNKAMENNPIQYYVRADTEARIRKDRNKMTTLEEQVFTEYWNSVNKKCSYQGHQASCSKREKYREWYQQQANKNKNKKRHRHRN